VNVKQAGRLALALGAVLLMMGTAGRATLTRADEPAKELTDEERSKLKKQAGELNQKADQLYRDGKYAAATEVLEKVLEIRRRLYPAEKYPDGHPDLANSLNNVGFMLDEQKEYGKAERFYRDALEMNRKLYPAAKYPDGRPELAMSLNNLGAFLVERGEYGKAEPLYRDALDINRRLYPAEKYPDGHPDLAVSLVNLGALLLEWGEYGKAADALAEGASMYDRLAAAFADGGAEAEALNLAASLPNTRNGFLAATVHVKGAKPAEQYPVLWQGKSALARGLQRRRRLLRAAADADEATRRKVQTLIGVRQDLARLVLAPARPGDADRAQVMQDLTDKKERLEKELAALLPASDRGALPYTNLADRLPDHAAFIDLYRYSDLDPKTRKWDDGHYAAFVLRKGRPIRRVELGNAAATEKDLNQWRQDITQGLASDAAARLRKAVWEPIAAALGEGVDTIYICPDGPLSALPWSALPGERPGERPGSVLLEDYAFAVVPGGPSLLDQLTAPAPTRRGPGVLLAVGGVRYDRDDNKTGKPWPALPATVKERAGIVAEARKLPHAPEIVERSGAGADVPRLLADLPKARWAHLATHGFFAAPDTAERKHLFRPDDFLLGVGRERRGAAARNPLKGIIHPRPRCGHPTPMSDQITP
jgi:CHAT domain-containing protein/Tfp pilus assembly protein PilF